MVLERFKPFLHLILLIFVVIVLALIEYSSQLFSNFWSYFNDMPIIVRLIMGAIPFILFLVFIVIIMFEFKEAGWSD